MLRTLPSVPEAQLFFVFILSRSSLSFNLFITNLQFAINYIPVTMHPSCLQYRISSQSHWIYKQCNNYSALTNMFHWQWYHLNMLICIYA